MRSTVDYSATAALLHAREEIEVEREDRLAPTVPSLPAARTAVRDDLEPLPLPPPAYSTPPPSSGRYCFVARSRLRNVTG